MEAALNGKTAVSYTHLDQVENPNPPEPEPEMETEVMVNNQPVKPCLLYTSRCV